MNEHGSPNEPHRDCAQRVQQRVLAAIALGDLQSEGRWSGSSRAGAGNTRTPVQTNPLAPVRAEGGRRIDSQQPTQFSGSTFVVAGGPCNAAINHLTNLALRPKKIMRDEDAESSFARNGSTHPMGKFDAKLPDVLCHGDFLDSLAAEAARAGVTASEFIRTTLYVRVLGFEHVASMEADRIKRIAGNIAA
jgi:hypothetical protein